MRAITTGILLVSHETLGAGLRYLENENFYKFSDETYNLQMRIAWISLIGRDYFNCFFLFENYV